MENLHGFERAAIPNLCQIIKRQRNLFGALSARVNRFKRIANENVCVFERAAIPDLCYIMIIYAYWQRNPL
jgi:hypothetical protein